MGSFAALIIGTVLMILIYAGGRISGAHYNPAVTLAFWIRGGFNKTFVAPYIFAQLIAAIVATYVGLEILPNITDSSITTPPFKPPPLTGTLSEMAGTFILAFVILIVATNKRIQGNTYYGFVIGATVSILSLTFGKISGGAFNPAVALGFALSKMAVWNDLWIYLLGGLTGGVLGGYVYNLVDPLTEKMGD